MLQKINEITLSDVKIVVIIVICTFAHVSVVLILLVETFADIYWLSASSVNAWYGVLITVHEVDLDCIFIWRK